MARAEQIATAAAVAAAALAGWSAWSSHRSAEHSKASARSAADAVALERDRRHDELTPRIRMEDSRDERNHLQFAIDGPRDYDSVRFRLMTPAEDSPIGALQVGDAWIPVNPKWPTEGDFGPMRVGDFRLVSYQRAEPNRGGTLRFRITCTSGRDTWEVPVDVEILPPPPTPFVY